MVTLQILVLPFLVRVRVAQHKREQHTRCSLFVYHPPKAEPTYPFLYKQNFTSLKA